MRSKAPLVMIEMLVMILVFALAAALCVRAFVWSSSETQANYERDKAVIFAENAAQVLKACAGDYEEAAYILGCDADGNSLIHNIELGEANLSLTAADLETGNDYLGSSLIIVTDEDGEEVYRLTTCWQEVTPDE